MHSEHRVCDHHSTNAGRSCSAVDVIKLLYRLFYENKYLAQLWYKWLKFVLALSAKTFRTITLVKQKEFNLYVLSTVPAV